MASPSESEEASVSNVEESRSRLCDKFAAIAGTDSAVAQCYLAENEWQMEVNTRTYDPQKSCFLFQGNTCLSSPAVTDFFLHYVELSKITLTPFVH